MANGGGIANPEKSRLHSKRSETSHEVWNAQSSHHNGLNSPGSPHSLCRFRSAAYSHALSPREETPHRQRDTGTFGNHKYSVFDSNQRGVSRRSSIGLVNTNIGASNQANFIAGTSHNKQIVSPFSQHQKLSSGTKAQQPSLVKPRSK